LKKASSYAGRERERERVEERERERGEGLPEPLEGDPD
jgi:hypothetical protein